MVKRMLVLVLLSMLLSSGAAFADVIDITLLTNPPYTSAELEAYLPIASTGAYEPYVGFNGANIGEGAGDGVNEVVAFSFVFQPLTGIENAYLTLELTTHGTETDELVFADNASVRGYGLPGARFYGNTRLEALPYGKRTFVTFDLMAMDYSDPYGSFKGVEDLSIYLYDGDLNVVYADDAMIHSARLRINTGFISLSPLPGIPPAPPQPCHVPEVDGRILLIMGIVATALRLTPQPPLHAWKRGRINKNVGNGIYRIKELP